jgi:ACS family allantoate permease-like MFS transporter
MYLVAYCVGNIIGTIASDLLLTTLVDSFPGPQTFRPEDAPEYRPAEITILVCWGACLIDLAFIWWYYRRQNLKKSLIRADPSYTKVENQEFLDMTDKENAEFQYSL